MAAELLFALGEARAAGALIARRSQELDGRNYHSLTRLMKTARESGESLACALILRALADDILSRAYAKAYGHAARYLWQLRRLDREIPDYGDHPPHIDYERALQLAHGRKTAFWARVAEEGESARQEEG